MFTNVSQTIKILAKIITYGGIVLSLILSIAMFVQTGSDYYDDDYDYFDTFSDVKDELYETTGWVTLIAGPIVSVVGGIFIYGFGELTEKATEISENTKPAKAYENQVQDFPQVNNPHSTIPQATINKRVNAYNLLKSGLITQEEYDRIVGV